MFKIFGNMNFLSPSFKLLAPYFAMIIILLGLSMYLFQNGYQKVMDEYNSLKITNNEVAELEVKISTLREINPSVLGSSDKTVIALPKDNPGTWVISQLKRTASDNSLIVDKIKLDTGNKLESISGMKLVIELISEDHNIDNIVNFLQTLEIISPVTSPVSVVIYEEDKEGETQYLVELTTTVYWSQYPTELPKLSEPVREITPKEQELLNKIISLRTPEFTELDAKEPAEREMPFNSF